MSEDLADVLTERICDSLRKYRQGEAEGWLTPELARGLKDSVFADVMLIAASQPSRAGKR